MKKFDFDLFVIGAGSGGVRASRLAAAAGAKVAVAEKKQLGGTCVNVGCVPKKLLVYASHYASDSRHAAGFGITHDATHIDWQTLITNKNNEIQRLNGIYRNLLEGSGVQIIEGHATLIDANTVEVDGQRFSAEKILLATGAKAYVPDFPGAEYVITSDEAFYLDALPERVVIVGGGYIAAEFAGIFNGLGVETNLIYRGNQLLRHFDLETASFAAAQIAHTGVNIRYQSEIDSVIKQGESFRCLLADGSEIETDLVMYATGRVPLTDGLNLDAVDVQLRDNGTIVVNEFFQTNEPSIFALGDLTGQPELTPVALAEATIFVEKFFAGKSPKKLDFESIPTAIFCQPPMATVGLSEESARERFANIAVYKSTFTALKHTLTKSGDKTFMKLLVDADTDKVLGAHMVGDDAGEIIQGIAIAVKAGLKKSQFDETIGIHPTSAEEFVTMRTPASD